MMANNYQNQAAPSDNQPGRGALPIRPGDLPAMSNIVPTGQWWYPGAQNPLDSTLQQQQWQQQQLQQQQLQQQQLQQQQMQQQIHQQMQQHLQQQLQQQQQQQQQQHQGEQRAPTHSAPPVNTPQRKMVTPAKVKDNKPKGRLTAYNYFLQTCRDEHKKQHPDEQVIFAEFSRKCGERWKTMLESEKQRFHEMAEKDKQRYTLEMQSYVPPQDSPGAGRGKKRKQAKDPNAPKRGLTAFFLYCNDERNNVKALNPDFSVGDVAKVLGRQWSALDTEVKQRYEQQAEKEKLRYEEELSEYKKQLHGVGTGGVHHPHDDDEDEEDSDEDDIE
ncbi:high mobility group protein B2-like [Anopheles ziemanni]|uniref:high mobility group protein B2-like n=1 Tax=Anopheles coustani TaxID=139045 RepID=UPI002658A076|nr:high mobility group protein B2-like [Anopheles coustani]XP_058177116.1 high mobility group protein B2-like [Anopheles ziemanni]